MARVISVAVLAVVCSTCSAWSQAGLPKVRSQAAKVPAVSMSAGQERLVFNSVSRQIPPEAAAKMYEGFVAMLKKEPKITVVSHKLSGKGFTVEYTSNEGSSPYGAFFQIRYKKVTLDEPPSSGRTVTDYMYDVLAPNPAWPEFPAVGAVDKTNKTAHFLYLNNSWPSALKLYLQKTYPKAEVF